MNAPTAHDAPLPPLVSVERARETLLAHARVLEGVEHVPVEACLGRALARDVESPIDVPGYDNSSMDGYAVRSADCTAPEVRLRVAQRIAAGHPGRPVAPGEAARIFTGAQMPEGADAVVIQEDCTADGDHVTFAGPVPAGQFVRPRGNDIETGARILAAGTRMRPQEMGLVTSVGHATVAVRPRVRVGILSTGDELLQPGEPLRPGTIYNSNRFTLTGLIEALGCELVDLGSVADTMDATVAALDDAARRTDVLVTSGGVSVGDEDHLKRALEQLGELRMWRVAVKPGKPLAYGRIGNTDVLGLPGNPVSTLVTFCLFVRPFLLRRQGARDVLARAWPVRAGFEWRRPGSRREFVRARVEGGGVSAEARIYPKQGSDVLASTAWADGLVEIPENTPVAPGDQVLYYPFTELLG